jgi:hypothetical protein
VPGSDPPDPNDVQWLVLDRDHLGTLQPVFDQLTSTSFTVVLDRDGIVVARRR